MLTQLPAEIIYHIAIYLPTAISLTNLAQTCHRLHHIITADDSRIYRAFVQNRFPSIETPPFWKDAAIALTSRSRAFDRRAVHARIVIPPKRTRRIGPENPERRDRPTIDYQPVIDSYEAWTGETWADRKEVIAWSAGAEFAIRVTQHGKGADDGPQESAGSGRANWTIFNDLVSYDSWDDICSLHLLNSLQNTLGDREHVIYGRRNGHLAHISLHSDGSYRQEQFFVTENQVLEKTDISKGPDPILAASLDKRSISLFKLDSADENILPFATLETPLGASPATRCSKLLSDTQIAVGFRNSRAGSDALSVHRITNEGVILQREFGAAIKNPMVNAIAPFSPTRQTGRSGDLLLAGWNDSTVRLHDLRSPESHVATFVDTVDTGRIYSILPCGSERFLVGSGAEAIVKIFDTRMPGRKMYSYLDARFPNTSMAQNPRRIPDPKSYPQRDFSMYLSMGLAHLPNRQHIRRPRSRHNVARYRGPIYTLSSPSSSSPTFYAGIEGGVIRLDVTSTDDLSGPRSDWYRRNLGLGLDGSESSKPVEDRVHSLSGYERPFPEESTSPVELRTQQPFESAIAAPIGPLALREDEAGWDRRWRRFDSHRLGWRNGDT